MTRLGNQSHLYGYHTINFENNRKILLSTIELETRRDAFQRKFTHLPRPCDHATITFIFYHLFILPSFVSICMRVLYLRFFFYILVLCFNFLVCHGFS